MQERGGLGASYLIARAQCAGIIAADKLFGDRRDRLVKRREDTAYALACAPSVKPVRLALAVVSMPLNAA